MKNKKRSDTHVEDIYFRRSTDWQNAVAGADAYREGAGAEGPGAGEAGIF